MRTGGGVGPASSARSYRLVTRALTGWLSRCSRGVDPRLAAERLAALEFELWEHALVADRRWSAARASFGLALHGLAAASCDLGWRRAARRGSSLAAHPPVHLLAPRHRQRFWVPLRQGHVFDQTNGLIDEEWPQRTRGTRRADDRARDSRAG